MIFKFCKTLVSCCLKAIEDQGTYGKTDLSESEELTDEERLISGLMTGVG